MRTKDNKMRKTTTTQICHEKKNLIKECNKLVSDINRDVIILIEWAWKILLGEKEIRLGEQQGNRWKESMLRRRRIIDGKCGMRTGCLSQCEYMKSLDTHTHTHTHTRLVGYARPFYSSTLWILNGLLFWAIGIDWPAGYYLFMYFCCFFFSIVSFFFTVSLYATLNSLYVYKYPTLKRKN